MVAKALEIAQTAQAIQQTMQAQGLAVDADVLSAAAQLLSLIHICSLGTILAENPTFPIRFLVKSCAGVLVGGEELERFMENGLLSNRMCYVCLLYTSYISSAEGCPGQRESASCAAPCF